MNYYIAFLDLLGTKSSAISDRFRYRKMIENFHEAIDKIIKKNPSVEVYVFSDCAYFQSGDILQLCDLLKGLRQDLIFDCMCFNAAVCSGELKTKVTNAGKNSVMIDFKSKEVVKVYSLQSRFTGAGIFVDESLIVNNEELKVRTVESIYQSVNKFNEKLIYNNYYDLGFGFKAIEFLKFIFNLYVKCYILDRRAARYYFALYATYIGECEITDFLDKEMQMINVVVNFANQIEIKEDKISIIMLLINRLYNSARECETYDNSDLNDDLSKALEEIYTKSKLGTLYNIKEIDNKIINEPNKVLLADFCFKVND